jgi:hypothetical protein
MYLHHLLVRDCKLMRQLEVSFLQDDGSPRLWTVFVGENGTCKTTLLRSIAIAAVGDAFANHLVRDPNAYADRRGPHLAAVVEAGFEFSRTLHDQRTYPLLRAPLQVLPEVASLAKVTSTAVEARSYYAKWDSRAATMREIESALEEVKQDWAEEWNMRAAAAVAEAASAKAAGDAALAKARAEYARGIADTLKSVPRTTQPNPIDDARRDQLRHWFIAGYGVGRVLTAPASQPEGGVPGRDRVKSLFDAHFLPDGTRFSDRLARSFGEQRAQDFTRCLQTALVERMHTPRLQSLDLRGKGSPEDHLEPIESQRFGMLVGGSELKLPAVWLSQGYQAVISLVADIIGNVWLEAGEPVKLDDMEGIVLVDELDLHLHPTWQTEIVAGLKATFPRMQFIVTTQSPLVLAGCRAEEVWTLAQDEATGDVTARQGNVAPMLLTTSEMYREYFGVSRTYASELGEALRRYVELASNPFRSDAEDEQVTALRKHLLDNRVDVDYQPTPRKSAS